MTIGTALRREVIQFGTRQSARWRHNLSTRFPDDYRNRLAAERLLELATEAQCSETLLDEVFGRITNLRPAISAACREIGFRHDVESLDDLLRLMLEQAREAVH